MAQITRSIGAFTSSPTARAAGMMSEGWLGSSFQ